MICVNIVIFHKESSAGWKIIADGQTRIFQLCDRYLNCMINWWTYYLNHKHVTARRAGNYLLAGKSAWRGWDSWWSQHRSVSCVVCQFVPGRFLFFSARFVRVGYLMVDKTIHDTWSSHDCLMAAPCATHRSSWVKQRVKHPSTKAIQQGECGGNRVLKAKTSVEVVAQQLQSISSQVRYGAPLERRLSLQKLVLMYPKRIS